MSRITGFFVETQRGFARDFEARVNAFFVLSAGRFEASVGAARLTLFFTAGSIAAGAWGWRVGAERARSSENRTADYENTDESPQIFLRCSSVLIDPYTNARFRLLFRAFDFFSGRS